MGKSRACSKKSKQHLARIGVDTKRETDQDNEAFHSVVNLPNKQLKRQASDTSIGDFLTGITAPLQAVAQKKAPKRLKTEQQADGDSVDVVAPPPTASTKPKTQGASISWNSTH